jgi:hypothetical protein
MWLRDPCCCPTWGCGLGAHMLAQHPGPYLNDGTSRDSASESDRLWVVMRSRIPWRMVCACPRDAARRARSVVMELVFACLRHRAPTRTHTHAHTHIFLRYVTCCAAASLVRAGWIMVVVVALILRLSPCPFAPPESHREPQTARVVRQTLIARPVPLMFHVLPSLYPTGHTKHSTWISHAAQRWARHDPCAVGRGIRIMPDDRAVGRSWAQRVCSGHAG